MPYANIMSTTLHQPEPLEPHYGFGYTSSDDFGMLSTSHHTPSPIPRSWPDARSSQGTHRLWALGVSSNDSVGESSRSIPRSTTFACPQDVYDVDAHYATNTPASLPNNCAAHALATPTWHCPMDGSVYPSESLAPPMTDADMDLDVVLASASPRSNANSGSFSCPSFRERSSDDEPDSCNTDAVAQDTSTADPCYAQLLWKCLYEAPDHQRPLRDIYTWMARHSPKASGKSKGWMNSVRHNLSMNAGFQKVYAIAGTTSKKGSLWRLKPEAVMYGVCSTTRYRKTAKRKAARASQSTGLGLGVDSARDSAFTCPTYQQQAIPIPAFTPRAISEDPFVQSYSAMPHDLGPVDWSVPADLWRADHTAQETGHGYDLISDPPTARFYDDFDDYLINDLLLSTPDIDMQSLPPLPELDPFDSTALAGILDDYTKPDQFGLYDAETCSQLPVCSMPE